MNGSEVSAVTGLPPRKHAEKGEPMKLLDEYISKTGKQPAEWTSQDIQKYLDHVKAQAAKATLSKGRDN